MYCIELEFGSTLECKYGRKITEFSILLSVGQVFQSKMILELFTNTKCIYTKWSSNFEMELISIAWFILYPLQTNFSNRKHYRTCETEFIISQIPFE